MTFSKSYPTFPLRINNCISSRPAIYPPLEVDLMGAGSEWEWVNSHLAEVGGCKKNVIRKKQQRRQRDAILCLPSERAC